MFAGVWSFQTVMCVGGLFVLRYVDTCVLLSGVLCSQFSMHSDLGQVMQTIMEEFKKNPPVPVQSL